MKICICDDEQLELERTSILVSNYFDKMNLDYSIETFNNAVVLLNKMKYFQDEVNFDVYLLDILMQVEGIELAKKIREFDNDATIIFITSSKEFAIEAFGVRAFDYILKPFKDEEFILKLDNLIKSLSTKIKKSFTYKTSNHLVTTVNIENIEYIESISRRIIIHLDNNETLTSPIIRTRFTDSIPFNYNNHSFLQCHSSYIVNLNKIKAIEKSWFVMNSGEIVPISKQYYPKVKQSYINYLVGE